MPRPQRPQKPIARQYDDDDDLILTDDDSDFIQPVRHAAVVPDVDDPISPISNGDEEPGIQRMRLPRRDPGAKDPRADFYSSKDPDYQDASLRAKETYEFYDETINKEEQEARNHKKQLDVNTDTDADKQPVRVDKAKKRILPFGWSKTKNPASSKERKLKDSEFDKRKNVRKQAKMIQWTVVAIILGIFAMSVKTAFFPPQGLSENDVVDIATQVSGRTEFPTERGRAFATDFMRVFLDNDGTNANADALGFFYSGEVNEVPNNAAVMSKGMTQRLIVGPEVYGIKVLNDSSAKVLVGAFVEGIASGAPAEKIKEYASRHWVFFNVNLFYDKKNDRMYIGKDSPTLTANPEVGVNNDLPDGINQFGVAGDRGDDKLRDTIAATVYGYIDGYAKSSADNHSYVDQYVLNDPSVDKTQLLNGLGGQYQPQGGEASKSTTITAFAPQKTDENKDQEDTSQEINAKVDVVWEKDIKSANADSSPLKITYTSSYAMTLRQSGGKWLVKSFTPYPYIPDPNAMNIESD